jgi:hypothetical protein
VVAIGQSPVISMRAFDGSGRMARLRHLPPLCMRVHLPSLLVRRFGIGRTAQDGPGSRSRRWRRDGRGRPGLIPRCRRLAGLIAVRVWTMRRVARCIRLVHGLSRCRCPTRVAISWDIIRGRRIGTACQYDLSRSPSLASTHMYLSSAIRGLAPPAKGSALRSPYAGPFTPFGYPAGAEFMYSTEVGRGGRSTDGGPEPIGSST